MNENLEGFQRGEGGDTVIAAKLLSDNLAFLCSGTNTKLLHDKLLCCKMQTHFTFIAKMHPKSSRFRVGTSLRLAPIDTTQPHPMKAQLAFASIYGQIVHNRVQSSAFRKRTIALFWTFHSKESNFSTTSVMCNFHHYAIRYTWHMLHNGHICLKGLCQTLFFSLYRMWALKWPPLIDLSAPCNFGTATCWWKNWTWEEKWNSITYPLYQRAQPWAQKKNAKTLFDITFLDGYDSVQW